MARVKGAMMTRKRRNKIMRNLDQVQILFLGDAQGLHGGHNAKLLARGADQTDLLVADTLVSDGTC